MRSLANPPKTQNIPRFRYLDRFAVVQRKDIRAYLRHLRKLLVNSKLTRLPWLIGVPQPSV